MKTTTGNAVMSYRILSDAKLGKMKDGDRHAAIGIIKSLKATAVSYDDFAKIALDKLKPENYDELQEKKDLTPEERRIMEKYNSDVNACLDGELKKEIDLDFTSLSDEGMKSLYESNDFTLGQILLLEETIGK